MNSSEALKRLNEIFLTVLQRSHFKPTADELLERAVVAMIKGCDRWGNYINREDADRIKNEISGGVAPPVQRNLRRSGSDDSLYVHIPFFTQTAVLNLKKLLTSDLPGVIIDICDCKGGDFLAALQCLELFCKDQALILLEEPGNKQMVMAEPEDTPFNGDLIVLCNHNTQSAAEVFIAGCKWRSHTLVIGERTFGKGSIQSHIPLKSGGTLAITTAVFSLPDETPVEPEGILPDILFDSHKKNGSPFSVINDQRLYNFCKRKARELDEFLVNNDIHNQDDNPDGKYTPFTLAMSLLKSIEEDR